MRTDGYGGGVILSQIVFALLLLPLLPFLPLALVGIGFVRVRDALERRAEARAVARV
jgi:hypothetical protein